MKIRCVTPTDFDQWKPLWQGYNHFYERTLPLEVTETTWSRFFDSNEPVHAMVAEKEGQLVGLVHYLFHRSTSMIEQSCYLQDLFTAESARGQGIGRALIEAVYEKAKSAGSSRVYWLTHETNVIAQNLYNQVAENSGFIVYRKQM
ncbi:MAG TPA: GNAT family N-acetyltransferase [Abditibacterium sp.]|jgi:GNAT superfamily N-acetyltransferase